MNKYQQEIEWLSELSDIMIGNSRKASLASAIKALEEAGKEPEPEAGQFDDLIVKAAACFDMYDFRWNTQGTLFAEMLEALRSVNGPKKFDVLEHLRKGGKISRPCWTRANSYCQLKRGQLCSSPDGGYETVARLVEFTDWQPYEESELEDGWYWCTVEGADNPMLWQDNTWQRYDDVHIELLYHPDGTPKKCVEG